jgi:tetratricopeptide (TPR) repeat protein
LQPNVPRDLETICLKCLDKRPDKRFTTAAALADDLRRFLDNRPIAARRSPPWERVGKWARRRPAVAALVGFVFVTILGAVIFAGKYLNDLRVERDNVAAESQRVREESEKVKLANATTEKQRQRAEDSLLSAVEAIERMLKRVAVHNLARMPLRDRKQVELLEDALALFDKLIASQDGDPRLRLAQAHTYELSGNLLVRLGRYDEAGGRFARAASLLGDLQADEQIPGEALQRVEAAVHSGQSMLAFRAGDLPAARRHGELALQIERRFVDTAPDDPEAQFMLAVREFDVGAFALAEGDSTMAALYLGRARSAAERLTRAHPREPLFRYLRAHSLSNLGVIALRDNDLGRAAELFDASQSDWSALRDMDGADVEYASGAARAEVNAGVILQEKGFLKRAEAKYRQALDVRLRLAREHPGVLEFAGELAETHTRLGRLLIDRNMPDDAVEQLKAAFTVLDPLGPNETAVRAARAEAYAARGQLAFHLKKYTDAEAEFAEAVELAKGPAQRERRLLHAVLLGMVGKPTAAVAEVDAALEGYELPVKQRFVAARALALAASKESDRHRADEYGTRAVQLLAGLAPSGFFKSAGTRTLLDSHSDLDSLRDRPDFKSLRDRLFEQ